jgi:hypothetical protein
LTGAAAIDGTGNAKANVITGLGTENILSGFCRRQHANGNDTLGSVRRWSAPAAGAISFPMDASASTSEVPIRLGCQCAVEADRFARAKSWAGCGRPVGRLPLRQGESMCVLNVPGTYPTIAAAVTA